MFGIINTKNIKLLNAQSSCKEIIRIKTLGNDFVIQI